MLLTCCTWLTAVFGVKTARAEGAAQWTPDTTLLKANPDSTVRGPFDSTSGFIDIVGQVNGQVQYTVRIDDGSDNRGPVETYPIKTWGGRVGYETQFDFDSFETEIDFTYLNKTPDAPKDTWGEENVKGEQLNLMLSSVTAGLYFGNDGCMITVQRQRDQAATPEDESRNYFFTVTSGGNGTSDVTFKGNGKAPGLCEHERSRLCERIFGLADEFCDRRIILQDFFRGRQLSFDDLGSRRCRKQIGDHHAEGNLG